MIEQKEQTVYSWSRLNSYYQAIKKEGCFYSFYKTYKENDRGESNYFAEFGKCFHELFEQLHKNEILPWDIAEEVEDRIAHFKFKAPFPKMGNAYQQSLRAFFSEDHYDLLFNNYTFLEIEEEQIFFIQDKIIKGYPDIVAQHTQYGFVIGDYKTSKKYEGEQLEHNIMQLYLYSIPICEKYQRYPDHFIYIFPREKQKKEFVYPFSKEKLEKTKEWTLQTIAQIENHQEWTPRCQLLNSDQDFFANHLCNHRNNCWYKYQ